MHNRIGGLMALMAFIAPLVAFAAPPPQNTMSQPTGSKTLTAEQLVAAVMIRNPGLQGLAAAAGGNLPHRPRRRSG